MANALQKQSFQRKLIYVGLILVCFTAAWLYRVNVVEARATELGLREETRSDVELTGSAMRYLLTGSRGFVICALWLDGIEKMKKNQWSEFEQNVASVTKLQPHFIVPWLFQSWNMAYNVSVEADQVRDKYYYIARGIQILAEGERQNQYNPDLRYHMGFYYQNKIAAHDEKEKLISLFQLSCIDPLERDPGRFQVKDAQGKVVGVKLNKFVSFAERHPQLVRRLNERVRDEENDRKRHEAPEDVVRFLELNRDIPSLFPPGKSKAVKREDKDQEDDGDRVPPRKSVYDSDDPTQRFPVLPERPERLPAPLTVFDPEELTAKDDLTERDDFVPHTAARAWFAYAQEPVPEPGDEPGRTKDPVNRLYQRRPKGMLTVIFRTAPARSQSYIAERLQEEGWLDEEWNLADGFAKVKKEVKQPARVGSAKWGKAAWEKAERMWEEYGRRNKLLLSPAEEKEKLAQAERYYRERHLDKFGFVEDQREEQLTPEQQEAYKAARFLYVYNNYRKLTNFPHFYVESQVEKQDVALAARKLFLQAQAEKSRGEPRALEKYKQGLEIWKDIFRDNPDYRADAFAQEKAYEFQLRYLALFQDLPDRGIVVKKGLVVQDLLGQLAARPGLSVERLLQADQIGNLQQMPAPWIKGPFDVTDENNQPYISPGAVDTVSNRFDFQGTAKKAGRPKKAEPEASQAGTREDLVTRAPER